MASGPHAHMMATVINRFWAIIKNFNLLIRDTEGNAGKNNLHITVSAGIAVLDSNTPQIQTVEQLALTPPTHAKQYARSRAVFIKPDDKYLILTTKTATLLISV